MHEEDFDGQFEVVVIDPGSFHLSGVEEEKSRCSMAQN